MQALEMHAQRRLAGTYYGGFNWVIMFVLCGLVFIYCCVYQVWPRWLRLYRHCFAKRLTRVLDEIDDFETMFEESRRVQQVDEETGELYWVDDRMQSEEMASSEEAAAAGGEGGGEESKEEVKTGEEIQLLDANGDPTASPVPSKRRKKPKALSPKKLMQLKQAEEEAAAYAEACRRALYVPLREEKLRIVREEFERRIEGGNMGWQLTVEHHHTIGKSVIDGMQLRDPRSVKFFHQLMFNDKMERGRPKRRYAVGKVDGEGEGSKSEKQKRSPSPKAKDAVVGSVTAGGIAPKVPVTLRRPTSPDPQRPGSPDKDKDRDRGKDKGKGKDKDDRPSTAPTGRRSIAARDRDDKAKGPKLPVVVAVPVVTSSSSAPTPPPVAAAAPTPVSVSSQAPVEAVSRASRSSSSSASGIRQGPTLGLGQGAVLRPLTASSIVELGAAAARMRERERERELGGDGDL